MIGFWKWFKEALYKAKQIFCGVVLVELVFGAYGKKEIRELSTISLLLLLIFVNLYKLLRPLGASLIGDFFCNYSHALLSHNWQAVIC